MMKIAIVLFSILFMNICFFAAQESRAGEKITFQDRVRAVTDVGPEFEVTFSMHAAVYKIPKGLTQTQSLVERGKKAAQSHEKILVHSDADSLVIEQWSQPGAL